MYLRILFIAALSLLSLSYFSLLIFNELFRQVLRMKSLLYEPSIMFIGKFLYMLNVLYFLSFEVVLFLGLIWILKKLRKRELLGSLFYLRKYFISPESRVISVVIAIAACIFIGPALIPFAPTVLWAALCLPVIIV